ncbi:hypothetical protein CCACVL1_00658, partial [Corchorus capsularis]
GLDTLLPNAALELAFLPYYPRPRATG